MEEFREKLIADACLDEAISSAELPFVLDIIERLEQGQRLWDIVKVLENISGEREGMLNQLDKASNWVRREQKRLKFIF
ncbi:MAG: hypothetical protein ABII21_00035 [bacterium]